MRWAGKADVEAVGERRATVPPGRVRALERKVDAVRFFERDEDGRIPKKPELLCTTSGTSTQCTLEMSVSICTDTPHAIVTVRRGAKTHTVQNDHCDASPLDELEALIDDVARTSAWIGDRVTD